MISFLPSLVILGAVAVMAFMIALRRPPVSDAHSERQLAARALAVALLVQAVHFSEELAMGFHVRFPALFGLAPIPLGLFILFNVAWIAAWIWSVPGLRAGRTFAYFAAWFLALSGMLNGIAHPVLAIVTRSNFPGLLTAPAIGLVALWLWRRLRACTLTKHHPTDKAE